jgi:hypothetical protein
MMRGVPRRNQSPTAVAAILGSSRERRDQNGLVSLSLVPHTKRAASDDLGSFYLQITYAAGVRNQSERFGVGFLLKPLDGAVPTSATRSSFRAIERPS